MSNISSSILTRVITKSVVSSSTLTGTGSETIFDAILIPKNTFLVGDIIDLSIRFTKSGVVGVPTGRLYFNTTPNLSGTPIISGTCNASATGLWFQIHRYLAVKASNNTETLNATFATNLDWNSVAITSAASSLNIDWTVDQYLVITGQLVSVLDSLIRSAYLVNKI